VPVVSFREAISDAIGYWERRRLLYNLALVLVVAGCAIAARPGSELVDFDFALSLFILAVLANIAYCAAYVVDVVLQLSSFRDAWRRMRWLLLMIGILFAASIAYFMSSALFFAPLPAG
jgi:hypothetical protein